MKAKRTWTWAVLLLVLGSAAFAADRAFSARLAAGRRDAFVARLAQAALLADRQGEAPKAMGEGSLKALVQELATREGLSIAFLSEGEKEAGKGKRERQVSVRLVGAEHAKLVGFLAELEGRGGGAVVKELHLRPSKDLTAIYQDAELVLALRLGEAKK